MKNFIDALERAGDLHRRAWRLRMVAMAFTSIAVLARCLLPLSGCNGTFVEAPATLGIIFLATFFTFSAEWSTRIGYLDVVEAYQAHCSRSARPTRDWPI
jgi:hypothetical protein